MIYGIYVLLGNTEFHAKCINKSHITNWLTIHQLVTFFLSTWSEGCLHLSCCNLFINTNSNYIFKKTTIIWGIDYFCSFKSIIWNIYCFLSITWGSLPLYETDIIYCSFTSILWNIYFFLPRPFSCPIIRVSHVVQVFVKLHTKTYISRPLYAKTEIQPQDNKYSLQKENINKFKNNIVVIWTWPKCMSK